MDVAKPFLILRYSLIQEAQGSLASVALPDPKGRSILISILNDREFTSNGVRYSFVGFSEATPTAQLAFPKERFFVGKTAKLRQTHVGEKVPGNIIEHQADDWIPLITVMDLVEQYIFIQKDWRFGTEEQICKAVQSGLRDPVLAEYNHRIFVEPKTRKESFWSVIKDHDKIYKISLSLISPNILETNKNAKEALKALKDLFGQDEVSITLENEAGDLQIPENPISDYVDYIAEGEGSWAVTTEGESGAKKTHTSLEVAETVEILVPSEDDISEEQQLELVTGEPAPGRASKDTQIVAEVFTTVAKRLRR